MAAGGLLALGVYLAHTFELLACVFDDECFTVWKLIKDIPSPSLPGTGKGPVAPPTSGGTNNGGEPGSQPGGGDKPQPKPGPHPKPPKPPIPPGIGTACAVSASLGKPCQEQDKDVCKNAAAGMFLTVRGADRTAQTHGEDATGSFVSGGTLPKSKWKGLFKRDRGGDASRALAYLAPVPGLGRASAATAKAVSGGCEVLVAITPPMEGTNNQTTMVIRFNVSGEISKAYPL
jgi:hypothetical protein